MQILILIGPPGCGKGTLAQHLQQHGYHTVSTGELLRKAAKTNPELQQQLDGGSLTDDSTVTDLLKAELPGHEMVLLDGFPRNREQVDILARTFPDAEIRALELQVPDEVALERIQKRAKEGDRPEDQPEVAQDRLKLYHQQTSGAIEAYRAQHKLSSIDGTGDAAQVAALADQALHIQA